MSVAVAYPESRQGQRTSLKIKEVANINAGYLAQARKVLRFCPEMVDDVMAGQPAGQADFDKN